MQSCIFKNSNFSLTKENQPQKSISNEMVEPALKNNRPIEVDLQYDSDNILALSVIVKRIETNKTSDQNKIISILTATIIKPAKLECTANNYSSKKCLRLL